MLPQPKLFFTALFFLFLSSLFSFLVKLPQEKPAQALAILDESILPATEENFHLLKHNPVYGISITEKTLQDFLDEGILTRKGDFLYGSPELLAEVFQRLQFSLPGNKLFLHPLRKYLKVQHLKLPSQIYLGFFPEQIEKARQLGLQPVLRIQNRSFVSEKALEAFFAHLSSLHPSPYLIFSGDEVLGFSQGISQVAKLMQEKGFIFARIEFAKQKGEERLHQLLGQGEWVHSLKTEEIQKLTFTEIKERYLRALRERSVRLFYFRPFARGHFESGLPPLSDLLQDLKRARILTRKLSPPEWASPPRWTRLFLSFLLPLSLIFLFYALLFPFPFQALTWLFLPFFLISTFFSIFSWAPPLLFALFFPSLVLLFSYKVRKRNPFLIYLATFGLLLSGALSLHAFLSRPELIQRIETFRGVKLAFLFPLLYASFLVLAHFKKANLASCVHFLQSPVKVLGIVSSLFLALLLFVLFIRTGNEGQALTSAFELKVRALLERLFLVRPRFKEAFLGYPALFLFLALSRKEQDRKAIFLLPLAALGLSSTMNTFCHLHTPLYFSLLRSLWGGLLGLVSGYFLLFFFNKTEKRIISLWHTLSSS